MKGLLRFLPWWVIIVVLLLGVAWSYRVDLARFAISNAIDAQQVENLSFTIAEINFSSVVLQDLSMDISTDNGRMALSGEMISADYQLVGLWQGRLQSVVADKVTISIPASSPENAIQQDIHSLVSGFTALLGVTLPAESMEIRSLVVELDDPVISSLFPLSLSVRPRPQGEKIRLANRRWNLDISRDAEGIDGTLSAQGDPEIVNFSLSVTRNPSGQGLGVHGKLKAGFSILQQALHEIQSSALDNFSGDAEIAFTAQPVDDLWQISVRGALSGYQSDSLELREMEIDTTLVMPSQISAQPLKLEISSPGLLAAKYLRSEKFNIDQLIWQPEGSAMFSDSHIDISLSPASSLSFANLAAAGIEAGQVHIVSDLDISYSRDTITIDVGPGTSLRVDTLETDAFTIQVLDATPDLEISYSRDSITIDVGPGTSFRAKAIEAEGVNMPDLDVIQEDATNVSLEFSDSAMDWTVSGGKWRIQHPRLNLDGMDCKAENLLLEPQSFSGPQGQATLYASEPECTAYGTDYSFDEVTTTLKLDNRNLWLNGQFIHTALPPEFSFGLKLDTDTGSGSLFLSHDEPVDLSIYAVELEEIFSLDFPELEISEGELLVQLDSRIYPSGQFDTTLDINLAGTSGTFQGISFSGLSVNGSLTYPPAADSGSARINVRQLQYGAEIENIEAELYLITPSNDNITNDNITSDNITNDDVTNDDILGIHFRSLKGKFLGSNLRADPFDFYPATLESAMKLHVEGLDIARIVELQQLQGLEISGVLDGMLPVLINGGEVSIEGGKFTNQPEGGMINYEIDPSVLESISNPLTDTVIKALTDFSYTVLTADVDYQPDGELQVDFHIEGSSPNLENGRPVHLNINSEQNVLSLLESLEYTSNLNKGLESTLRNNPLLQSGDTRTDDETD